MANCFVSIFACCARKKREVVPFDSNTYSLYVQNVGTQTPMPHISSFLGSESLPSIKLSEKVVHKGIIMVRNGDSFQSQSSEEFSKPRTRKCTVSPTMKKIETISPRKNNTLKGLDQMPFVYKGSSMPKLNPITPRRTTKNNFSLPLIKKASYNLINESLLSPIEAPESPSNL